ncbi:uncharacterized protein LOC109725672 [Ananas comosus]|uniref:Uncharacterized protein LOC109725672 n=1 Tax=Ananas comosus TaxID=4615 RepID=A0A6P5GPL2_ANACO|nr:uncharacterized protein LOC109725672 [Ananas comosus]
MNFQPHHTTTIFSPPPPPPPPPLLLHHHTFGHFPTPTSPSPPLPLHSQNHPCSLLTTTTTTPPPPPPPPYSSISSFLPPPPPYQQRISCPSWTRRSGASRTRRAAEKAGFSAAGLQQEGVKEHEEIEEEEELSSRKVRGPSKQTANILEATLVSSLLLFVVYFLPLTYPCYNV